MSGSNPPFPEKSVQILPLAQESLDFVEKRNMRPENPPRLFENYAFKIISSDPGRPKTPDLELNKARAEKIMSQIRDLRSGLAMYNRHDVNTTMRNNLLSIKHDIEKRIWTFSKDLDRAEEIGRWINDDEMMERQTSNIISELLDDYLFYTAK